MSIPHQFPCINEASLVWMSVQYSTKVVTGVTGYIAVKSKQICLFKYAVLGWLVIALTNGGTKDGCAGHTLNAQQIRLP